MRIVFKTVFTICVTRQALLNGHDDTPRIITFYGDHHRQHAPHIAFLHGQTVPYSEKGRRVGTLFEHLSAANFIIRSREHNVSGCDSSYHFTVCIAEQHLLRHDLYPFQNAQKPY